jgi:cbb3-type cytochrome oxidase subunit 3
MTFNEVLQLLRGWSVLLVGGVFVAMAIVTFLPSRRDRFARDAMIPLYDDNEGAR